MIINRSSTPCVMKNINKTELPVFWRSNKKAWITQDAPTSNPLVNENKENEWVPNVDLQDVKKGLNLAKELELHFIQTDHSTVRSAKFKRELRNCLAPYREVLVELEKKATIENQCEDEPSEEDILPIKRRRIRRLILSDSEDEC